MSTPVSHCTTSAWSFHEAWSTASPFPRAAVLDGPAHHLEVARLGGEPAGLRGQRPQVPQSHHTQNPQKTSNQSNPGSLVADFCAFCAFCPYGLTYFDLDLDLYLYCEATSGALPLYRV